MCGMYSIVANNKTCDFPTDVMDKKKIEDI